MKCDREGHFVFFQIIILMKLRTMYLLNEFDITKKQVLKSNYSMRTRVFSHIVGVGYKRFGASTRLFNDEAKRVSSFSKVTSAVNFLSANKEKKDRSRKIDIHNLSEPSETQQANIELNSIKVGLSEVIQKKSESVEKKEVIKKDDSLNELMIYKSHETSDLNMMIVQDEKERIEILVKKIRDKWDDKKKKFVNLHKIIFDPQILIFAYSDIVKSKGANTKGGDVKNLDGINPVKIYDISEYLLNGSWVTSPARRVLTLKKKVGETRPLTALSLYDKIVATAIQIVLSLIYEKHEGLDFLPISRYFSKVSHGFRQGKGCHTALNIITTWGLGKWLLSADIYKCFDNIDQKRLVSILNKSIEDQLLIDILYKFFNAPIKGKERRGSDSSKGIGIPQGNPFSPLLMNIYLNEFDQFILTLKKEIDKGKQSSQNTKELRDAIEVKMHEFKRARSRKAKNKLKKEIRQSKIKTAKKVGLQQKSESDKGLFNNVCHRIYYVRYADDYLIVFKGPKKTAKIIKERSENFLKSNLHFKIKEGKLVNGRDNKATFLGFDIKVPSRRDRAVLEARRILSFKKIKNKISARKNALEARFEKAVMKTYEAKKLKTLKTLLKNTHKVNNNESIINSLAVLDAKELMKTVKLKGIKWLYDQEPFETWMQREYIHLKQSWIKDTELKELGFDKIINAYNNFLMALEKERSSENICKIKNEEAKFIMARPKFSQKEVDRVSFGQQQSLQLRLYAPIYELKNKLKIWHMISESGKPKACGFALKYEDISIIEFFKQKALGFLNYYSPASNFHEVKRIVNYHLRWSLIHTLAAKFSTKVHKVISKYGKTPKVILVDGEKQKMLVEFLTPNDINHRSRGFFITEDPFHFKNNLDKPLIRLSVSKALFAKKCAVLGCTNTDIEVHSIKALRRVRYCYSLDSIKSKGNCIKRAYAKVESALNRKQIPLCKDHHSQWHSLKSFQLNKEFLKTTVIPKIEAFKNF